jgi:predicted MFS family arabinose efflux permease
MMSAVGAGALVGAVVTSRISSSHMRLVPCLASALFGAALAAFALSEMIWLSLLLLVPAGFGMMSMGVATNTLIQGIVADAMRGRVMAYYVMSFIGIVPVSSLLAGWISHEVGAPLTLAAGGILCVAAATWMWVMQSRSRGA